MPETTGVINHCLSVDLSERVKRNVPETSYHSRCELLRSC